MKKRLIFAITIVLLCLLAAAPALAADVFKYAKESVEVFDGQSVTPELIREGKYAEGEVVYQVRGGHCIVDENGTITGIDEGRVYVQADLYQNGKKVRYASILVIVSQKAAKISLNNKNLQIYEPDDEQILALLDRAVDDDPIENQILVLPVGKKTALQATVTPQSVRNKRVTITASDPEILTVRNDGSVTGAKRGECELTIASVQDPSVVLSFHVLVVQPVKKITVSADAKTVAAGSSIQLKAAITPDDATIQSVEWHSRNEKIATVDRNGVATGVARGNAVIEAVSTDGSGIKATFNLTVIQGVTEIIFKEAEATIATGKTKRLQVTVNPSNANNRKVKWTSSDETIATVKDGVITGKKAGECIIICESVSNPEVFATIPVHIIQMVTDISFVTPKGLSIYIGDSSRLEWKVSPDDATIKDVTFRSKAPKIAAVDQDGIVTGLAKGQADIEVKATDGSGRTRVYRVTILKHVEGINPLTAQYYVPLRRGISISTSVYPSDASNKKILWSCDNENIATIRSTGDSKAQITGKQKGWATVTAITEEGGFATSTSIVVDDFDTLITCNSARIDKNNKIRLVLWNMSRDFTVTRIYYRIDCYDTMGAPMVCNKDGKSTFFTGTYGLPLYPGEHTEHGKFTFQNYKENGNLGYVVITVTGYDFDNGQKWTIPESIQKDYRYQSEYSSHMGEPTPAPEGASSEDGNG